MSVNVNESKVQKRGKEGGVNLRIKIDKIDKTNIYLTQ